MNKRLFLLSLIGTLWMTGCSSLPPLKTPDSQEPSYWQAKGKFSYRSGEVSESGNFDWRQNGNDYQLRLYGPLGMGSVRISGNANLVRIQAKGQDISSDQPLSLLYRITGFEIPLNSMTMWLTGKPSSLAPTNIVLDDAGNTIGFTERQWQLKYSDFEEHNDTLIPMHIRAARGDIRLRMIVKSWQAGQ